MRVINWDTNQATSILTPLNTATTFYVNSNTGSDTNNTGSNAANPFQTIQGAYNYLQQNYNFMGQTVTIQCATGVTMTSPLVILGSWTGGGILVIDLGTSTWSCTGNTNLFLQASTTGYIQLQNGTLQTAGGSCINLSQSGAQLYIGPGLTFGAVTGGGSHLVCEVGATVNFQHAYTISGGAACHILAQINGQITYGPNTFTVTVSGNPAFTTFAQALWNATIFVNSGIAFSGSATGTRYDAEFNSVIYTTGGGANFFPGNSAGTTSTGGQYG